MTEILQKLNENPLNFSDAENHLLCKALEVHLLNFSFFLSLEDENPFRARAYRRAALSLQLHKQKLLRLIQENALESLADIGPSIASEIHNFAKRCGKSCELERLRQRHPTLMGDLLGDANLEKALIKAYRFYNFQEPLEFFFLLESGFFSAQNLFNSEVNQSLLRTLTQKYDLNTPPPNLGGEPRRNTPQLRGMGAWLFRPKDLEDPERAFLHSLDYILHPARQELSNPDQLEICYPFPTKRSQSFREFLETCEGPFINLFACPGFFSCDLNLSHQILNTWTEQRKTLILPLHPCLKKEVHGVLTLIKDKELGSLFTVFSPQAIVEGPSLLQEWIQCFDLNPRKILNFASGAAMKTYLLSGGRQKRG
jgi:hypothetical protein